ncbi:MAG: hypothetical protein H0X65_04540 [Gemmatimonadetes bacterium]|nr:hypothetical protein [Gemmatimonadota bacterium]
MISRAVRYSTSLATGLLLVATHAAAQVPPTARALGMGGAYVATARGHEALFLNPANLGLPGTPYWSIAMPQIGISGSTAGPTFPELYEIIKASKAEPSRRSELLAQVPADGMQIEMDARLPLVAIQSRHLVLGASYGSVVDHSIGKDLIDLFVNGYEEGRTDYTAGNTTGSRATFVDFAAGYGRRVGPISLGVTGHYILGRTLSRAKLFEPRIDPGAETIEVEYREVMARGGQGYGVDVGAAYQPARGLTVSAVIANAFARMKWNESLTTRSLLITHDDFGAPSRHWEDKLSAYAREEEDVDPDATPLSVYETARDLYEGAYFPTTLRAGIAYRLEPTRTQVEASYQRHLSAGRLGGAWEQGVAVGIQQRIPLLVLRGGAATNLDGATLLGVGITLGSIELGAARLEDQMENGTPRTGWVGTFGLNIRTRSSMP